MFVEQIDNNKKLAFEHLAERKKQNKDSISINGNEFSYITKRGLVKKYIGFNSFSEYRNSELYMKRDERVDGFYFVEI